MVLCIDEFENLLPDKLIVPIDQNLYRIIGAVVESCINNIIGGVSVNFILDIIDSTPWEFQGFFQIYLCSRHGLIIGQVIYENYAIVAVVLGCHAVQYFFIPFVLDIVAAINVDAQG